MRAAECSTRALRWIVGIGNGDNGGMNKKAAKDKGKPTPGAAKAATTKTIALNKRAKHEYHLEQKIECGIALQGWELKAIRAGRANIGEAYAIVKDSELYLFGAQITPLISASTHVIADNNSDALPSSACVPDPTGSSCRSRASSPSGSGLTCSSESTNTR